VLSQALPPRILQSTRSPYASTFPPLPLTAEAFSALGARSSCRTSSTLLRLFCFLALLESSVVIGITYLDKDYIFPVWLLKLLGVDLKEIEHAVAIGGSAPEVLKRPSLATLMEASSSKGNLSAHRQSVLTAHESTEVVEHPNRSISKGVFHAINTQHQHPAGTCQPASHANPQTRCPPNTVDDCKLMRDPEGHLVASRRLGVGDIERFLLYETLFYELDDVHDEAVLSAGCARCAPVIPCRTTPPRAASPRRVF
jgi:hypothetical protein